MNKDNFVNIKIEKYVYSIQQLFSKVKNGEIESERIPLLNIIKKYLSYLILAKSEYINLDITADFLLSVSNLILWKSTLLLPVCREEGGEEDEDETNESREGYWEEYRKYQSLIQIFEDKEIKQKDIYLTYLDSESDNNAEDYQKNHFSELILAIESIISRKTDQDTVNITRREYNIMQKIEQIEEKFKENKGKLSFQEMISNDCSKIEVIIVFLALLELICQGKVDYRQPRNFGEIIFYRKEDKKLKKEKIQP